MQNPYPPSRVLISNQLPLTFEVAETSTYQDIFTPEQRNAMIAKYQTPNLFNGCCIRLDSLQNNHAVISPVMFYDFFCCNIIAIHNRDQLAWPTMQSALAPYGKLDSVDKILSILYLPNIIGTCTLLHDCNDEYLLVERNTAVSVGSGLFASTSSGSLDDSDLYSPNPIIGCGERELIEELNLKCNLSIQGLIIPIQKMQPIALLTGQVFRPWRQLLPLSQQGADFTKENNRVLLVPKDKLLSLISFYSFTDAAAFQIFFEAGGNQDKWRSLENTFINVNDFYVV